MELKLERIRNINAGAIRLALLSFFFQSIKKKIQSNTKQVCNISGAS